MAESKKTKRKKSTPGLDKLKKENEDLKKQIKRMDFANKSVFDVVSIDCGFSPINPQADDGSNEGGAVLIIKADGSYDLICSYFNDSCRNECKIMKVLKDDTQNFSITDSVDFLRRDEDNGLDDDDMDDDDMDMRDLEFDDDMDED